MCRIFAAKLFDLMGWDGGYCYKVMGNPAVYGEEMLFLFQQTDFELFLGEKKPRSYLPGEWRDYFGTPVERHEESCIFADTLRRIGSPKRICFLMAEDGRTMLLRAHRKRDLQSHKVPGDVYSGGRSLEISSQKLCQILAELHGWNMERSYRVPDMVAQEALWVVFHLDKA